MNETSLAAKVEAWHREMLRTERTCATYFARRVSEWIALSHKFWGSEFGAAPHGGRTLQQELMYSARREVELRGEFTKRAFGDLAERGGDVPSAQVLVECTRKSTELLRLGTRDLTRDIEHASRILPSMDSGCVERALSTANDRITDYLLDLINARRDFGA